MATSSLRRALVALLLLCSLLVPAGTALGQQRVASGPPLPDTARIVDGDVLGIDRSGDTVVVVGEFTTVRDFDGTDERTRRNVLAFDLSTGDVSTTFAPQVDGIVHAVHVDDAAGTVLIAGAFRTVDGTPQRGIARLDLATGELDPTWRGTTSAAVLDIAVTDEHVVVAGRFDVAGGVRRPKLAVLERATGRGVPDFDVEVTGILTPNATNRARQSTQVVELDVTDDGRWLAVLGNHTELDGLPRAQVGIIDMASFEVADWRAPELGTWPCYRGSEVNALTYVRHVKFSPDGTFLVTGSALAFNGGADAGVLCDSVGRFAAPAAGPEGQGDVDPTWVEYTGGDTVSRLEVTDAAVYAGGHQRWHNHPYEEGFGAVERLGGLAALDPTTGVPLSWQPDDTDTRPVYGYQAMLADGDLLLLGRDGNLVGGELRQRVAAFSTVDGPRNPAPQVKDGPLTLHALGSDGVLRAAPLDGATLGASAAVSGPGVDGVDWGYADDGFLQHGQLVTFGQQDTSYYRRPFAAGAVGAPTNLSREIDYVTADPPRICSLRGCTETREPDDQPEWVDDTRTAAYVGGRMLYTRAGSQELKWRWYGAESGIVGGQEFTVDGSRSWRSNVRAMTVVGDRLLTAWSDGRLLSWPVEASTSGLRVVGGASVVDTAASGIAWQDVRTLFTALPDDTSPPATSIDAPADGAVLGTASNARGGATDDRAVVGVEVTVRSTTTGRWLQPDGRLGDERAALDATVDGEDRGDVAWRLDLRLPDDRYELTAAAVDGVGTRDGSPATRVFEVVSTPPSSTVEEPAARALVAPGAVEVAGSASAPGTGVASVGVTVRDRDTRDWLQQDGSFGAAYARVDAQLADPGAGTSAWLLPVDVAPGRYAVTSVAVAADGQEQPSPTWSPFEVVASADDDVPPGTVVEAPARGAAVPAGTVTVTGTAGDDDAGLERVDVAVRDLDTGTWLQPDGSFAGFAWLPAELEAPGATASGWQVELVVDGPRRVAVTSRAVDAAGNVEQDRPWAPFDVG